MAAYKEAVQKREDARNALRSEREQKRQQAREPKPRTVSAYSLFYKDFFATIKDELGVTVSGANAGTKLGPVAAAIAAKWKALSEEERQVRRPRTRVMRLRVADAGAVTDRSRCLWRPRTIRLTSNGRRKPRPPSSEIGKERSCEPR